MKTTIHQDTHQLVDAPGTLTPSVSNGKMTISAALTDIEISEIVDFKYKEDAAGTNERVDVTVAAPTAGKTYKITLLIKRGLGTEIEKISASVVAATSVAASVAAQLVAAVNALAGVSAVINSADVRITLETATGEVAGEGDIVATKVSEDGSDPGWTIAAGVARVVPFGQGTQVKRFDDAAGINFHGTAVATDTYDEATFILASESGTERRRITVWLKAGTTDIAWARSVLQSLGSFAGSADGSALVATDADANHKGDIYIGCPEVVATGTGGAGIDLVAGAPVGSRVRVLNLAGGADLTVTREGSETINGAASLATGNGGAIELVKMTSLAWSATKI